MAEAAALEGPGPQTGKYDDLLAAPAAGTDLSAPITTIPRAAAAFTSADAPFLLSQKGRSYDRQYAQLYFTRLVQMRPILEAAAATRWPGVPIVRVLDIPDDVEKEVVVIGTLYKEMALKPSILDEYTKERALAEQLGRTRFTAPDDRLVLEDEGARVTLAGAGLPPGGCVAGVVAAVRGAVLPNGEFDVREAAFAGMAPQAPLPPRPDGDDVYVALVSGLGLGSSFGGHNGGGPLALQLLADYCAGALGGAGEQATAARIARVVVAGGLLSGSGALSQPTAYANVRAQATALEPVREADVRLTELAASTPVDVMPGAADPANYSLPQQPLHRCLFPGAAAFPTFTRSPNPHAFDIDGVHFLGTSGQNVDDVARYSEIESRTEILGRLLEWRHLIPTAPDTLAAYPYHDRDPFILGEAPHVLFAGGQPEFGTALVGGPEGQRVRVVAVPDFATTGTAVLVNLRTLGVHPLHFETAMDMVE